MLAGTLCNMVIDSMLRSYVILHDIVTFTMLYSTDILVFLARSWKILGTSCYPWQSWPDPDKSRISSAQSSGPFASAQFEIA